MYKETKLWSEADVPKNKTLILIRCTKQQNFDPKQML